MSTKICTSIEQSKKLLSLGLDPSTADMFYPWHIADEEDTFEDGYLLDTPVIGKYGSRGTIPCWSLTALLELMPATIRNCQLTIDKEDGAYNISYDDIFSRESVILYTKYSLIDAAFEMVCWLIEQGYSKVKR